MRWPDFLVIGAAKSGTTSLFNYLAQHPDIYMSPVNEPNYFALHGHETHTWFQGPVDQTSLLHCVSEESAYGRLFENAGPSQTCGESSPLYLYSEHTAEAIQRQRPDMKLVVILRQPADRAYSNFRHHRKAGIEPIDTFPAALAAEPERIRAGWGPWPFWHYRRVGQYAEQLQRYLDRFDRSQLHIMLNEDLRDARAESLAGLFAFLGVDPRVKLDSSTEHNRSALTRSRRLEQLILSRGWPKRMYQRLLSAEARAQIRNRLTQLNSQDKAIDPVIRASLTDAYADDIGQLAVLIDRDLDAWLQ
jgi:hypothetical protein